MASPSHLHPCSAQFLQQQYLWGSKHGAFPSTVFLINKDLPLNAPKLRLKAVDGSSGDGLPDGNTLSKATHNTQDTKTKSIVCDDCDGNGAILCSQCKGSSLNSVDHFNGQFKAGQLCWLCRGKKEILCGNCNGAGFIGGFMSTFDE
ncbi:unnamed protein product [Cuscuta europaea]|uniref:BSD2 cysteine rich domain-containing protein n=1 Tax=Cuscuta europaea TaxID=41803 RepID=A0A9P1EDQ3_CUSEU|nr:unnamed protein product [Cuscuta europaea]